MILLKLSWLFSALPPETTRVAEDRSGLDETVNSSEMNLVDAGSSQHWHGHFLLTFSLDSINLLGICRAVHRRFVKSRRSNGHDLDGVTALDLQNGISSIYRSREDVS